MTQAANNVVELGARDNMTPEEALALCQREDWERVMIIGYKTTHEGIIVRSSHMTRESALWIIEHAKLHVMDQL